MRLFITNETDPYRIQDWAQDPDIEFDVSALRPNSYEVAFAMVNLKASIYSSGGVFLPCLETCGDITAPNASSMISSMLRHAGTIDAPMARCFHMTELVSAEAIIVPRAELFVAPKLEAVGAIVVHEAMGIYAENLKQAGRIEAYYAIDIHVPKQFWPVDAEGQPANMRANFGRKRPRAYERTGISRRPGTRSRYDLPLDR